VANANTIPAAPHAKSFDHTPASTTAVHTEKATLVSDDKTSPVHSSAAFDGHSSQQPAGSHQKSGDDKQQQQQQQFSNNAAAPQLQQSVKLQTTQAVQSPAAHQAGIAPAIAPQHASINAPGHVQAMASTAGAGLGKNLASQPASVPRYSPVINSSKLIERLGESEIRIGLQTHDFGPVEIKTLLQNQELHAHISVEHTALRDALAADLPALQKSFEQQRIAVHSLNIQDHSTAWNGGGSSPRHPQQFSSPKNQLAPELKQEPRSTAADPVTPSQITGIDLHA
jgi:flagellar hook-length control protein FliK